MTLHCPVCIYFYNTVCSKIVNMGTYMGIIYVYTIHICICICICIYIYMYMHIYVHIYIHIYIYMYLCMYACVHIFKCRGVCARHYICMSVYACLFVCMYVVRAYIYTSLLCYYWKGKKRTNGNRCCANMELQWDSNLIGSEILTTSRYTRNTVVHNWTNYHTTFCVWPNNLFAPRIFSNDLCTS